MVSLHHAQILLQGTWLEVNITSNTSLSFSPFNYSQALNFVQLLGKLLSSLALGAHLRPGIPENYSGQSQQGCRRLFPEPCNLYTSSPKLFLTAVLMGKTSVGTEYRKVKDTPKAAVALSGIN